VSPNVGLVLALPASVELFTRYAEGFRAPSLGELYFPFYGNPDLLPEQSASWELGLRHQGERWWASVAGFSTELDNLIETDPLTFTAVNVGRARIEGAEVEVGYRRGTVDVRANATWLDTEDRTTGENLLRRPDRSVNALLSWRPEPFIVTLTARWVGERDALDPLTFSRASNDAYWVADVGATWQASARWAPFGRIQNVSDESYEEVLGFPAPGRTLIAGIEVAIP
jgi:vitamin B12 transporter